MVTAGRKVFRLERSVFWLGIVGMMPMLDAEAEVYILLVAGVGVEVIRRATIELVPLTHLAANEETESHCAEAGGDPAYGFDKSRFIVVHLVLIRERELGCGRDIIGLGARDPKIGAKLHAMDDTSR
jgi:hypothetical protein